MRTHLVERRLARPAGRAHRTQGLGRALRVGRLDRFVGSRDARRTRLLPLLPPGTARGRCRRQICLGPVFALALESARFLVDGFLPREWIIGDGQLRLTQPLDLVAQARRLFEVQVGGGFAHAAFEIGQHGFEVVADGHGVLADACEPAFGRNQNMIALVHRAEDVGDREDGADHRALALALDAIIVIR